MEKMYQFRQKWKDSEEPVFELEETLDRYCDDNPCQVEDPVAAVENAGHSEFLRAVYEVFFERKDPKKHLVLLYGKLNAGKSSFIKMFQSIFSCQRIQFEPKHITVKEKSQPWAMQIVVCPEFSSHNAFNQANVSNMNSILEGDGADVRTNLYKPYEHLFEGAYFLFAANSLPAISDKTAYPKFYQE